MRKAKTILAIIRERGKRGLPLERIYRLLFNRDLYLLAYSHIYPNRGAMTPGSTTETADGMSVAKIDAIIDALRYERYRWTPARRVYIEKKNSTKKRPLGIPAWSDKLLQEVIRLIFEAYYEPQFSPHSHGFRPGRGCHTALDHIRHKWTGTAWFIEGDISQCFDKLDHEFLLSVLREKIHDNRFLRLIENLLKAGYLEDWKFNATLSGTPQGGVVSPILSNIYLDRLDKFVETELLPTHNRGERRQANPIYVELLNRASWREQTGRHDEARALRRELRQLPSRDPNDPEYRRLRYVRYADDFILGLNGPRAEAEEIKRQIGKFLHSSLKLELSDEKTLITNARTAAARFLGYDVGAQHDDNKLDRRHQRSINGRIGLRVPLDVVRAKCKAYLKHGKPIHRAECINDSVYSIVAKFQQEYRGIVEYYQLAYNLNEFGRLRWIVEQSLTKTLARKLRISVPRVYARYQTVIQTDRGPRKVLQVTVEREGKKPLVARWGGIPLTRRLDAVLDDQPKQIWNVRTELEQRLLADTCELCGSRENVEVHHIRALRDLERKGRAEPPEWVKLMAARHRKTLIVCRNCHTGIHIGHPTRQKRTERDTGEPDDRKRSSPVCAVRRVVASPIQSGSTRRKCLGYQLT